MSIKRANDAIEASIALSGPAAHGVTLGSGGLIAAITISGLEKPPEPRKLDVADSGLVAAMIQAGPHAGETVILLIAPRAMRLADAEPPEANGFRVSLLLAPGPEGQAKRVAENPIPQLAPTEFPEVPPPPSPAARKPMAARLPAAVPAGKLPPAPAGMAGDAPLLIQAARGDEAAMLDIATLCMRSQPPQYEAARRWLEYAAAKGSALASFDLGQMSRRGVGGGVDEAAALRWYRLAASRGFAAAQYNLALMLLEGRGTPPDPGEARRLLKAAADQGYEAAKPVLAELNR